MLVGPLKLHPLDLLLNMSPLAFIQTVLYAHFTGELEKSLDFFMNISTFDSISLCILS
jgi:hypothetical protein